MWSGDPAEQRASTTMRQQGTAPGDASHDGTATESAA